VSELKEKAGASELTGLARARAVQLIWQDAAGSLNPRLRVGAAIAEPLKIHSLATGREMQHEVARLLDEVGLNAELALRFPHELSGGEAQRVVIARALALQPQLLICDEPASALDARLKAQLAQLLRRLGRERGLAYLIIAHDLSLVRRLTERLYVMYRGKVVETGPTGAVLSRPLHPYTQLLVGSDPSLPGWNPSPAMHIEEPGQPGACDFLGRCRQRVAKVCESQPEMIGLETERAVACLPALEAQTAAATETAGT
jgi:oligopeptide/dipeptide ABC transporter ATP-binding protein